MVHLVTVDDAQHQFDQGHEFAFVDIRELAAFGSGHPFLAAHLPWSRLELDVTRLVPRRTTPVLLTDAGGELTERAADRLHWLGYTDVGILEGGAQAWHAAGRALFPEIEVPAKAFGAFARIHGQPPFISPDELAAKLEGPGPGGCTVLDARPMDEYCLGNIPGSINAPSGEVLRCFADLVPDAQTDVVVNCMSATRGILGGLSLLAARVPNDVRILHHGTRGWLLAGHALEIGAYRLAATPSPEATRMGRERAAALRARAGLATIDLETLSQWRADLARTTYVFDVRTPAEYESGHVPGAHCVPEGKLVMSPERYFATRNARLVLTDDDTIRATVTALWLSQMGWGEVVVLTDDSKAARAESGPDLDYRADPETELAAMLAPGLRVPPVAAQELRAELAGSEAPLLLDVSQSDEFCSGHLPGALWVSRPHIMGVLQESVRHAPVVITSQDGMAAALVAADLHQAGVPEVRWLADGNRGWVEAGHALTTGDAGPPQERVDHWLASSERPGNTVANVNRYLDWETGLLDDLQNDGLVPFKNLLWPEVSTQS